MVTTIRKHAGGKVGQLTLAAALASGVNVGVDYLRDRDAAAKADARAEKQHAFELKVTELVVELRALKETQQRDIDSRGRIHRRLNAIQDMLPRGGFMELEAPEPMILPEADTPEELEAVRKELFDAPRR